MEIGLLLGFFVISFIMSLFGECLKEFSRFQMGEMIDDLKKENKGKVKYLEKKRDMLLRFFEKSKRKHLPFLMVAFITEMAFISVVFYFHSSRLTPFVFSGITFLALVLGVCIFTLYLFNRLFAGNIAEEWAESIVFSNFTVIRLLSLLFIPLEVISKGFDTSTRRVVRFGKDTNNLEEDVEDEIIESITEGVEDGVLEEDEKRMIESVLEFDDSDVKEVMTPRTDIVSIPSSFSINEAINIACNSGYSRIPVIGKDIDDITGILYVKDLLQYAGSDNAEDNGIAAIKREAYFIPESKMISELFQEIREKKNHFAVVLDEYGGTAGIVTAEDIIEEIVGEIEDEYDEQVEDKIVWRSSSVAEVDARIDIGELNDIMNITLPDENDFESLGGFLASETGKIPQVNEVVTYENIRFKVLRGTPRKLQWVEVRKEAEGLVDGSE